MSTPRSVPSTKFVRNTNFVRRLRIYFVLHTKYPVSTTKWVPPVQRISYKMTMNMFGLSRIINFWIILNYFYEFHRKIIKKFMTQDDDRYFQTNNMSLCSYFSQFYDTNCVLLFSGYCTRVRALGWYWHRVDPQPPKGGVLYPKSLTTKLSWWMVSFTQ